MPCKKNARTVRLVQGFSGNLSHNACFSKQIRIFFGRHLRVRRNRRIEHPIMFPKKLGTILPPEEFATCLGKIFQSDLGRNTPTLRRLGASADVRGFQNIHCFQTEEVQGVQVSSRKAGDVSS